MIVAVDKNWAIGNKGQLLVSIPEDRRRFREETLGKVIVMGRKTLKSLPGKQILYGRTNVVLTGNPDYKAKGAIIVHNFPESVRAIRNYSPKDCFIIGGESIYRQFLPLCDTAYVTYIDYSYVADNRFPNLDREP